jgi:hypothetical protein
MPGSLDDLSFTVWPPAIDISTPANQQIFNPQFGVTNTSATETVSLTRALLLVPVMTTGTNLAQNTDMVPNAITPGWTLSRAAAPPSDQGYAAFALLPNDGKGAIPPGSSVAFVLTGVTVNAIAGTAVLRLEAKTSAGSSWAPTFPITLTTPSTTPTIMRYTIIPAEPQTLTTLQGQTVALSWTTSGAAYCMIQDDQGNNLLDPSTGATSLPTSGTLADEPVQGDSPLQSTPKLGRYYNRTYTLYAFAGGEAQSDERPAAANIRLPTIFSMTMSATSLDPTQPLELAWSIANIDATAGSIALAIQPQDGSPSKNMTFKPGTPNTLVPAPAVATNYALTLDNGYGIAEQETLTVPDLPSGWTEVTALETLPAINLDNLPGVQALAVFGDKLWCGQPIDGFAPSSLYWTSDAKSWTPVTVAGLPSGSGRPSLDGLVVADLGEGERLWAFGNSPDDATPYVAKSADGINWQMQPRPPYPRRWQGAYVATPQGLLVMGGIMYGGAEMQGVWASKDGATWTKVGTDFPSPSDTTPVVAPFAGKLYAFVSVNGPVIYVSANGGATWTQHGQIFPRPDEIAFGLMPLADKRLYLFGSFGDVLAMDASGAWSKPFQLPNPMSSSYQASAIVYAGHIWAVNTPSNNTTPQFFRLAQPVPGTVVATQSWRTPS